MEPNKAGKAVAKRAYCSIIVITTAMLHSFWVGALNSGLCNYCTLLWGRRFWLQSLQIKDSYTSSVNLLLIPGALIDCTFLECECTTHQWTPYWWSIPLIFTLSYGNNFMLTSTGEVCLCQEFAKGHNPRSVKEAIWTPWEDHKNCSTTSKVRTGK